MAPVEDDPRTFIVVPPAERPVKQRRGSRIIVRSQGRVLVEQDTDPGIPGSEWWVTPGGGVDAGETWAQAVVRELFEETGCQITEDQLVGPVAHRVVTHGYSDRVLVQEEMFFIIDLDEPFTPSTDGFTHDEQITLQGFAWLTAAELADVTVWPAQLPSLVAELPATCLEWGEVEESTVPVGD